MARISSHFEAGIQAESFHPDCIIVDFSIGKVEAMQICQNLRRNTVFAETILIALLPASTLCQAAQNTDRAGFWDTPVPRQKPAPPAPETCGACHHDKYSEWSGSRHAHAFSPGLLGQIYDGLQNPLESIAAEHGFFLPRGVEVEALDSNRLWPFAPSVRVGDSVRAGDAIGSVSEGRIEHKIMVPFDQRGEVEITIPLIGRKLEKRVAIEFKKAREHERTYVNKHLGS